MHNTAQRDLKLELIQIDDMDSIALHEDVVAHFWIPAARQVTEMGTGLEEIFDRRAMRRLCLFFAHYIEGLFRYVIHAPTETC